MKLSQRGFNLISLMIGMTLSLISILAMLTLYKNTVRISIDSIKSSRQDGQIAASLLTAQQELRNAGFWLTNTPATTLKLLSGAALTGTTLTGTDQPLSTTEASGNALVWIYQTGATTPPICAGLLVQRDRDLPEQPFKLLRLQASSCSSSISSWSSLSWSSTTLIETNQDPTDFFKAIHIACWPFGKATPPISSLRVKVTINAVTSVEAADSTASAPTYVKSTSEVCLPNLAPATST